MKKSPIFSRSLKCMRTGFTASLTAILLSATGMAQLAGSGTPGDHAVYQISGGPDLAFGLGSSIVHDFDIEVIADTGDSFELGAEGSADDSKVFLTGGHHLVLYGASYFTSTERTGVENFLKINGSSIPYGASAAYTRDATNNYSVSRGGTILNVSQGDALELETVRTDVPAPGFNMTPDTADLQLLKLDDTNLEYLRLSAASDSLIMPANNSGPVNVSYTVQDEINTNSFAHSTSTNSEQITLKLTGHYLIFANTGFSIGSTTYQRNVLTQQVLLNGSPVAGGATTVYLRHANPTDGAGGQIDTGAASIGMIVEVTTPDSVLEVEVSRDNVGSPTTVTLLANRTSLAVAKLPGFGDYVTLSGPSQFVNEPTYTLLDFSSSANVANTSFTYNSANSVSDVTINQTSDYLVLSSHYGTADEAAQDGRSIVMQSLLASGSPLGYGNGGIYNRDRTAPAERSRLSGAWAGAILPLNASDFIQTSVEARGGTGLNSQITTSSVGLQALNIASISGVPNNPVLAANTGLSLEVSTSETITSTMLETVDGDNTPAELTYTLLSAPSGGSLTHSVNGSIGVGNTFTQDDINQGRIGFSAGATPITTGGFDFEVVDPSAIQEVEGRFDIAVGVATVLADDDITTDEDSIATTVALGGSSLLDNDTGTSLTVTAFDTTSVLGAAVSVSGDGTFSYDPTGTPSIQALDDGDSVVDSFTISVTDYAGATTASTVTVDLSGVNDVPVLVDDSFAGTEFQISSGNLLANDSDPDALDLILVSDFDGMAPGTFTSAQGATISIDANGNFTYDPSTSAAISALAAGATLVENFTYTVSDGSTTQTGTVSVTSTGVTGTSNDVATTDAASSTNVAALANDTVGGTAGTATGGAVIEFLADNAANTDVLWNNTGTTSDATASRAVLAGATLLNTAGTPVTNAPAGVTAAFSFTGGAAALNDSGMRFIDIGDDAAWGTSGQDTDLASSSIELVFRPSDQTGTEMLFETGGTTVGTSVVLVDNLIVFTTSDSNGSGLQTYAPLPASAVAGGEFVHFIGRIDLGTDTIDITLNGVPAASATGQVNLLTGAPDDLTDWSGTDDGGIGPVSGAIGGDLQLGNMGTIDINGAVDFAGEVAVFRIYQSLLDAGQRQANYEAVFGVPVVAATGDIIDLAGTPNPVPGSTVITLPSGATVTFESNGTFTYNPNGAFDHIGVGLTATDTFEYTLNSQPNSTATVSVIVSGLNPDPQLNISSASTNVTEGATNAFTISSTAALASPVNVQVSYSGEAVNGTDFNGSTTVAVSSTPFLLNVTTIDDGIFEGAENVEVTLESVISGPAVIGATPAAGLIIDDAQSPPEVTAGIVSGIVFEGGTADFTLSLSNPADTDILAAFSYTGTATAGADYYAGSSLVVPAGSSVVTYKAILVDDLIDDNGETLSLTLDSVDLGTVGATNSATATIVNGSGQHLFAASFEGVVISPSTGANAPAAADEGTQVGSWSGIPVDTTTGGLPGVVPETGDFKLDGADNYLRIDRPALGTGDFSAVFSAPADFSGSNTALISFDIGQNRTQNDTEAKSTRIYGYDSKGEKSFELFLSANNNNPQLFHVDSIGTLTPLGDSDDFLNMQNSNGDGSEGSFSRVTLFLEESGFNVVIDRWAIDGAADTITTPLPYAGTATQVAEILFSVNTDLDDAASGGIGLDDFSVVGIAGNVGPSLTLDGSPLADAGATAVPDGITDATRSFSFLDNLELQVADPDAASLSVQLTAVSGLGTVSVSLSGGAAITSGANGTASVTVSGTVADLNATLAAGVDYTAGATGGAEILRVSADDSGSSGAGGAKSVTHDLTFTLFEDPTVTIEQAATQNDPALIGPVVFTAVFSEPVQGFNNGATDVDLSASTTAGSLTASISETAPNDGTTYTVSVSGMTGSGNVIASIPAGAAQRPGSLENNVPSSSIDNVVEYIQNAQPLVTNATQPLHYLFGALSVDLKPVIVEDPNHMVSSTVITGEVPFVDYPAVNTTENFTTIDPVNTEGLTLEVKFTPESADVTPGGAGTENRRIVFEIGGSSNGTGIYLIDGIPYFISKMNSAAGQTSLSLNDPDWEVPGGDEMVVIPLSATPLLPGVPAYIAIIFRLDDIEFSVNGDSPTFLPLSSRVGNNDWAGDNSIGIGLNGPTGGPGGLSNAAGTLFFEGGYQALTGISPFEYARMWNAISPATSIDTVDRAETITATLSIDGYVDDSTSGFLSASSGNGEVYAGGVWSITAERDNVNAALAAVTYTFGSSIPVPVTISVSIEDGDEDGSGPVTGKVVISEQIASVVYVDDDFSGSGGEAIADADLSIGNGNQPATFLVDAFTSVSDAVSAVSDFGLIIVNDGDYSTDAATLTGFQALQLADTAGGVNIGSLRATIQNSIDMQSNSITLGAANADDVIGCAITGGGGLTKTGSGRLILQDMNTYPGTTTVSEGILRVGHLGGVANGGLAGGGPVVNNSRIEFNPEPGTTMIQTGAISGTGLVATMGDGTVEFNGPNANTFTGGFELGDGTTSNFDGIDTGNAQGFTLIHRADHLGPGPIRSRGSQLQAAVPGLVISNDINVDGGGFRVGGFNDMEFSGNITPINAATRGYGNYGLEGLDLVISGNIDNTEGNVNFEGVGAGKDNGTWTVTGDISGPNSILVQNTFTGGVVTFTGTNTYAGTTTIAAGTLILDGNHTGGAAYAVNNGVLAGSGSTDSAVNVGVNGVISPGPGTAVLSIGQLTMGGLFEVEIEGTAVAGTDYDQLFVTGTANLTGSDMTVTFGPGASTGTVKLIDIDDFLDSVTGEFVSYPSGAVNPAVLGRSGSISYAAGGDFNDVELSFLPPSLLTQWRLDNGFSADGSGPGEANGDIGPNGRTNLENFAMGFDAQGTSDGKVLTTSDATITQLGGPQIWRDPADGKIYFQFIRRADYLSADLIFDGQYSTDLVSFVSDFSTVPVVFATGTGDDGVAVEAVQLELPATVPVSGSPVGFARLFIVLDQ